MDSFSDAEDAQLLMEDPRVLSRSGICGSGPWYSVDWGFSSVTFSVRSKIVIGVAVLIAALAGLTFCSFVPVHPFNFERSRVARADLSIELSAVTADDKLIKSEDSSNQQEEQINNMTEVEHNRHALFDHRALDQERDFDEQVEAKSSNAENTFQSNYDSVEALAPLELYTRYSSAKETHGRPLGDLLQVTKVASDPCDRPCTFQNHTATCLNRMKFTASKAVAAGSDACSYAHVVVGKECAECQGCILPASDCPDSTAILN